MSKFDEYSHSYKFIRLKRHAELALMCDIVIAADDATFEDTAHFHLGSIVPGDGINIVYTMLMGLNRARYLMLTGQVLSAREAKDMGLIAELLPRHELLPRAWELAEQLAKKPEFLLRYTRMVSFTTISRGVRDGARTTNHARTSKPGNPASPMVSTSGGT